MKLLKCCMLLLTLGNVNAALAEPEVAKNNNESDVAKEHNKQMISASLSKVSQVDFHGNGSISKVKGDFYLQLDKEITKGKSNLKLENTLRNLNVLPFNQELSLKNKFRNVSGNKGYRFNRVHQGLVVEGADIIVELDNSGKRVETVTNTRPISSLPSRVPLYSKQTVENILLSQYKVMDIELKYYAQANLETKLVWFVVMGAGECVEKDPEYALIDANNGSFIKQWSATNDILYRQITTYKLQQGYDGCDISEGYEVQKVFNEIDKPSSSDRAKVLWDNLTLVRDFYKNSNPFYIKVFNGENNPIVANLYLGSDKISAGWSPSGQLFKFHDLTIDSIEIVGHEFTHAFMTDTESVPNLEYIAESGALNESFADIVGMLIEEDNLPSSPTQQDFDNLWLSGEDTGTVVRNFSNPKDASQILLGIDANDKDILTLPAEHYSEYPAYNNYYSQYDNGGVHVFSSVSNLAFYLLVNGGTHPNPTYREYTVNNGIGLNEAFDIFYTAYQNLNTNATFEELRKQTVLAAAASGKTKEVCTIWEIVGVPVKSGDTSCDGVTYDSLPPEPVTGFMFEYGSCNMGGRFGLFTWYESSGADGYIIEYHNGSTWVEIYDGAENATGRVWTEYGNHDVRIKAYNSGADTDWVNSTIYVPSCQGGGGVIL